MADANDRPAGPGKRDMIELARIAGEALPIEPDVAYIIVAVDVRTGNIGWISQVPGENVTEVLGNIVASRRN